MGPTCQQLDRKTDTYGSPRRRQSGASAFTLLEILVAVSIIALLIAILLPTLRHARKQARDLHCASNLRSTASAVYFYTQASRDYYPSQGNWAEVCSVYAQKLSISEWLKGDKRAGLAVDFYLCPDDPIPHFSGNFKRPINGNSVTVVCRMSYGLSGFLVNRRNSVSGALAGTNYSASESLHQTTEIKRPSDIVLLTETGNDGLTEITELFWDFDEMPDEGFDAGGGFLEVHHANGNHFIYADQHVEYKKILRRAPWASGSMGDLLTHIRQSGVPQFPRHWIPLHGLTIPKP